MNAFIRFNVVGVAGFCVQLGVLVLLERRGWPVAMATLVAVEAALLHNFAWHERWTWTGEQGGTRAGRCARFHIANGTISLAGNAVLTPILVIAGFPLVFANGMAVIACALLNFIAARWCVFYAKTWPHIPWAPFTD